MPIDELLRRVTRTPPRGQAVPALRTAIVTCMDARIDPARVFGLEPGEAHVMRNAGAVVTDDVVRSVALSQHALGTRSVLVVGHTACGLLGADEDVLRAQLGEAGGGPPPWPLHTFADLERRVADSVARLRGDPYLVERDQIGGYVYDVETGEVRTVDAPSPGDATS